MVSLGNTSISLHILQLPLGGGSSDLDSGKKIRVFNFRWGVFSVRSDLDSGKKIRVFNFGGRCSG